MGNLIANALSHLQWSSSHFRKVKVVEERACKGCLYPLDYVSCCTDDAFNSIIAAIVLYTLAMYLSHIASF